MKAPTLLARLLLVAGMTAAGLAAPAAASAAPSAAAAGTTAASAADDVTPFVVGGRPASQNYSFLVYTSGCTGSLI